MSISPSSLSTSSFFQSSSSSTTSSHIFNSSTSSLSNASTSTRILPSIINSSRYKHKLKPAIVSLAEIVSLDVISKEKEQSFSEKASNFQNNSNSNEKPKFLRIEDDAIDHFEQIILDIFNLILLAPLPCTECKPLDISRSTEFNNESIPSIMSLSGINSPSSVSLTSNKIVKTITTNFRSNSSHSAKDPLLPNAILNLGDAEFRVREILPKGCADIVCESASNLVEDCCKSLSSSVCSRIITPNNNWSKLSSSRGQSDIVSGEPSSKNKKLASKITFPVDYIHKVLSDDIYKTKLDILVTVYLVHILEKIAKDMLYLTIIYSRSLSNQSINIIDFKIAIEGDTSLTKIYNSVTLNLPSNLCLRCQRKIDDDECDTCPVQSELHLPVVEIIENNSSYHSSLFAEIENIDNDAIHNDHEHPSIASACEDNILRGKKNQYLIFEKVRNYQQQHQQNSGSPISDSDVFEVSL
jgi:hypothetical protein